MKKEQVKQKEKVGIADVMASGLLFDQFKRNVIRKYNGICGYKMPNYAPSIIIRYNLLHLQREFIKVFKIRQVVKWLSFHLP